MKFVNITFKTYFYICTDFKITEHFIPRGESAVQLFLTCVLSPGGSLLCRLLRGPIVFNLGFIGVGNVYWTFFSLWGYARF